MTRVNGTCKRGHLVTGRNMQTAKSRATPYCKACNYAVTARKGRGEAAIQEYADATYQALVAGYRNAQAHRVATTLDQLETLAASGATVDQAVAEVGYTSPRSVYDVLARNGMHGVWRRLLANGPAKPVEPETMPTDPALAGFIRARRARLAQGRRAA